MDGMENAKNWRVRPSISEQLTRNHLSSGTEKPLENLRNMVGETRDSQFMDNDNLVYTKETTTEKILHLQPLNIMN